MPPTTDELALDSLAIGVGVAIRDTGTVAGDAYARMREGAKDDAEHLLVMATGDDEDSDTITARKRIVLHLGVNQLAQAINYHAMIHAGLVIDADTDERYAVCPVCHAELVATDGN